MNRLSSWSYSSASKLHSAKYQGVKVSQSIQRSVASTSVSTKRRTSSLQSGLSYVLFGIAWIGLDVAMYYILQYNRANPLMKKLIIEEIEREEREAAARSH